MNRRAQVGIVLLALVIIGAFSLPLFQRLEHYQEVVDQGPSPEARANPYLAAQHFLQLRSIPVSVIETLHGLPDNRQRTQSLMLLDTREDMTPAEVERVLAWARSGGRLLFVAEQLWDDKKGRSGDLLLDQLQIHQFLTQGLRDQERRREMNMIKPVIPLSPTFASTPQTPWPELTRLYVQNETDPAYMSFDPEFHLDDPQDHAQSWANSADATHMLQMIYGKGLITVVTDANLWKNRSIGKYDNAWLLWYLTQDTDVTLLLRTEHADLFSLLNKHFPLALTSLTLLTMLTLWRVGMREGPLQPAPERARRQLSEHLRASADFLLRRRGQQLLLRTLQTDILRRARQRHPGFDGLVVAEQWQALARLTRQPVSAVGQALRPRPSERLSRSEFTRQVAYLQTLRNAL
ncbi:DUF4350 domain-containing protein [Pseudomonas huanghezhanensis]|uniref:DUF4350 domain-containing protein n=1 Tax=Pseudomonas huanghezhanensis TaxID=3002903 RepID=UPI002285927E|nr:DUF4350 domain-containing protein [Pseudomonas sp. BSw22131]